MVMMNHRFFNSGLLITAALIISLLKLLLGNGCNRCCLLACFFAGGVPLPDDTRQDTEYNFHFVPPPGALLSWYVARISARLHAR